MKAVKNEKNGVVYYTFPLFEREGLVHGFSTRIGGVSKGDLATMNLSFTRGDDEEAVRENHRRFAGAVGYDVEKLVFSNQVHETDTSRGRLGLRQGDFSGIGYNRRGRPDDGG